MNNLQINEVLLKRKQQILPSSILKGEFNQDLKIEVAQLNNVLMKLGYRLSYNLTQYLMMTTKEYILEVKVFLLKKITTLLPCGNRSNIGSDDHRLQHERIIPVSPYSKI